MADSNEGNQVKEAIRAAAENHWYQLCRLQPKMEGLDQRTNGALRRLHEAGFLGGAKDGATNIQKKDDDHGANKA